MTGTAGQGVARDEEGAYLLALGSNMRHPRIGSPRRVLTRALDLIGEEIGEVTAISPFLETPPVGPSRRRYLNAAAIVETGQAPLAVMRALLAIEARLGRKRLGQDWQSRVLDLDIVLWSAGPWAEDDGHTSLVLPHPVFRQRDFVLAPARTIAGTWRDPLTGLSINQLYTRLTKPRHAPR